MDKGKPSALFANDGSFMERFKQLQQETNKEKDQEAGSGELKRKSISPAVSASKPVSINIRSTNKPSVTHKTTTTPSSGKLAFSLKQKSKLVAPAVKLDEDEEEDEVRDSGNALGDASTKRLKSGHPDSSSQSSRRVDVAPLPPSDPTVKNVADKLASFVAKHGRSFEHVTLQKNPGDTPFKFLYDTSSADYKYYEYRLHEEEKALAEAQEHHSSKSGGSTSNVGDASRRSVKQQPINYQTPASALYDDNEANSSQNGSGRSGEAPSGSDPLAMMEYYMKKAAQEERKRPYKQSHDEMPPPPSLQGAPGKRGHHMGDYIPLEELSKFMSSCNDVSAQKYAKEAAERAKIQADNVGHKLLSKMGWKEGEGLGSSRKGIADPIMAGDIKDNNLGVGAHKPGEVLPEDDIYEQYKKRMMLGYRHRPNPLNNPRKAYY
ncbi:hypothetical protein V2J09_020029 [Rumex salicifolius]